MSLKLPRISYVDPATVMPSFMLTGAMDALQRSKSSPEYWANAKPFIKQAAE